MQTLKNTVLLLLNISTIAFLGYIAQSSLLSSFVMVAFILFCVVAMPFLSMYAVKQYLDLSLKPRYEKS